MTKHVIALVRLAKNITQLLNTLVYLVRHEDLQTLVNKLHSALDLIIRKLDAEPAKPDPEPELLYDAKSAAARIGVGERTIYRLTQRGLLPVHSYVLGMRQFRHSDIERCRRFYRGE